MKHLAMIVTAVLMLGAAAQSAPIQLKVTAPRTAVLNGMPAPIVGVTVPISQGWDRQLTFLNSDALNTALPPASQIPTDQGQAPIMSLPLIEGNVLGDAPAPNASIPSKNVASIFNKLEAVNFQIKEGNPEAASVLFDNSKVNDGGVAQDPANRLPSDARRQPAEDHSQDSSIADRVSFATEIIDYDRNMLVEALNDRINKESFGDFLRSQGFDPQEASITVLRTWVISEGPVFNPDADSQGYEMEVAQPHKPPLKITASVDFVAGVLVVKTSSA